jgi:hypothetical protein
MGSRRFPARAESWEQSWDRILTCVGKSRYPKRCQPEKLEQFNRESPDEKRVGASLAF